MAERGRAKMREETRSERWGPRHEKSHEDAGLSSQWDGNQMKSREKVNGREKQTPSLCP